MRVALAVALLIASSMSPAFAGTAEDVASVMAADRAFSALSVKEGSNAAFLAYLADDGRLLGTGNEAPILGKDEAIKRFANSGNGDPKTNVLSWEPEHGEVSADGALAWTDGKWTFDGGPKEHHVHLTGRYMTVWRKDAAGMWKVASDMGTNDPAPK
jgi:ketosteroid isomerase-like protein